MNIAIIAHSSASTCDSWLCEDGSGIDWQAALWMDASTALTRTAEGELDGLDAAVIAVEDAALLVRRLRRAGAQLPLVVVAADKADLASIFAAGADDHVTAPVGATELACRLSAINRRRLGFAEPFVELSGLRVHLDGQAPTRGGEIVALEPRLLRTLTVLARNAGRVVSRDRLHDALYADQPDVGVEVIKVHICRLRQRLAAMGVDRGVIETVSDIGYRLRRDRPGAAQPMQAGQAA